MAIGWGSIGVTGAAIAVAGLALSPALSAATSEKAPKRPVSLSARGGIGSFTPASADPRIAASFGRAGVASTGFRFTPAGADKTGKAVTVAVRARASSSRAEAERLASTAPSVSITPIAYNLGVSLGWKRFAISGDVARIDTGVLPGGREKADIGVSYNASKWSARVQASADRPTAGQPSLIAEEPSYSLDVGGSYSIARNVDVTAGVRYRMQERDRLQPFEDDRRDSQAVYIGTAFKF